MNTRDELFARLKGNKMLEDDLIAHAFETIDRKDFVPEDYKVEAYEDYPLPIGHGQTISQPTTVAFMLEKLGAKEGDRVLDVGTGSGWTTALLSKIVGEEGEVFGVEKIPKLVELGKKNISKYKFFNAQISQTKDQFGAPEKGPFNRILVSASASDETMAKDLLDQLDIGGTMVIPIGSEIVVYKKESPSDVVEERFPGFVFVPLVTD